MTQFDSYTFQLENEPVSLLAHDYLFTAAFDAQSGAKLIRMNKFDLSFQMQWPNEGYIVHQSTLDQRKVKLFETADGIGVVWSEIRDEVDFDLFYQRFNLEGQMQFDSSGVTLMDGVWVDNYVEGIYSTPDSNFILVWVNDVWGSGSLSFQKFNLNGEIAAGWPSDGYTLSSIGDPEKLKGQVISDESGILVAWEETYNFNKNIKAILFDMDGVLIDSEPLFLDAINRIIVQEGRSPISEPENEEYLIGTTVNQTWEQLKGIRVLPKAIPEYIDMYDVVVKEVLSQRIDPQPGVVGLLNTCKELGIPKAVASSSLREEMVFHPPLNLKAPIF